MTFSAWQALSGEEADGSRSPWRRGEGCLLGLVGPAGAGKSAAAAVLAAEGGFVRESYAAPIRHLVVSLYPEWADRPEVFGQPLKEVPDPRYGVSPRQAMRTLGEGMRAVDAEIWLLAMARRLRGWLAQGERWVVVDDVRREAEAAQIRDLGGHLLHIERLGVPWRRDHDTEMGIRVATGDQRAYNHGDLASWQRYVRHYLVGLRSGAARGPALTGASRVEA